MKVQFAKDSLGTRMKRYEDVSRNSLTPRMPVIVRVDGRAFHTYTRGFQPFDNSLRDAMVDAAKAVAAEMQGFEVAYHQSDEVSFLLTDYASLETSSWFDYNVQKVSTIAASVMTAHFNKRIKEIMAGNKREVPQKLAYFDARAYNVPKEDVANYFLWRCKDWERNSLQMYCRTMFSSKQLFKKNRAAMHEMLHGEGKNWATDVSAPFRNGSFVIRYDTPQVIEGQPSVLRFNRGFKVVDTVRAEYPEIAKFIEPLVYKVQVAYPPLTDVVIPPAPTVLDPQKVAEAESHFQRFVDGGLRSYGFDDANPND